MEHGACLGGFGDCDGWSEVNLKIKITNGFFDNGARGARDALRVGHMWDVFQTNCRHLCLYLAEHRS
jgi:hypothetical protein